MIPRIHSSSGITVRSPRADEGDFRPAADMLEILISGEDDGTLEEDDSIYNYQSDATTETAADLRVDFPPDVAFLKFENRTPEIASYNPQTGRVSRVSDGMAKIDISSGYRTRRVKIPMVRNVGAETRVFTGFVNGSLAHHAEGQIAALVAGKTSANMQVHNQAAYTSGRWTGGIDMTFMSREIPRCTLVAPDIVLMAEHYQNAGPISFLAADGTAHTRTITERTDIGPPNSSDSYSTDVTVGKLSSELPSAIRPTKVLPATIEGRAPGVANRIPACVVNRDMEAMVCAVKRLSAGTPSLAWTDPPRDSHMLTFCKGFAGGDSGSPVGMIVSGEFLLLGLMTGGSMPPGVPGVGGASRVFAMASAINAAMTTLGSSHQLTIADLSAFPTY